MNKLDAPRTRAEAVFIWPTIDGIKEENHPCGDYVPARLSFELERENNLLREALKRRHAESGTEPRYL